MEVRGQYLINFQKVTTLFFILFCMWRYDNWGPTAFTYLALHGSYGYCWMIKEAAFPNKSIRDSRLSPPIAICVGLVLFVPGYWNIARWAIMNKTEASPWLFFLAIFMYVIGVVVMMVSDCQTYFILKYNPGKLIVEGMNRYTREPNYSGEVLLYLSFCTLARSWEAWLNFAICYVLVIKMAESSKETSLSRYPAWKAYKRQTFKYVPNLFAYAKGETLDKDLLSQGKVPEQPGMAGAGGPPERAKGA